MCVYVCVHDFLPICLRAGPALLLLCFALLYSYHDLLLLLRLRLRLRLGVQLKVQVRRKPPLLIGVGGHSVEAGPGREWASEIDGPDYSDTFYSEEVLLRMNKMDVRFFFFLVMSFDEA